MEYNNVQRKRVLSLARLSIETYLNMRRKFDYSQLKGIEDYLKEERATFVTLEKNGELRGCIGTLEAYRPLYIDVIEHAYSSAFEDTRFPPVNVDELEELTIKVSILSSPTNFNYFKTEDIFDYFSSKKVGVIISAGVFNRATFLPDVWNDLPSVEDFFSHLCIKAGLAKDYWRNNKINIQTYTTETFGE